MPLDSDVADADASLHVEFYEKKDSDPPGLVYCRIVIPGDKTFTHDQPVRDSDKARFPRHWLHFQMKSNEQGPAGFGTSLDQWVIDEPQVINENQRIELFALRFQTVEQVAMATDAQIQRMGLGALGMRDAARRYLKAKSRGDADGEQDAMKAQIAQLTALVEKLSNPTAVAIRAAVKDIVPLDPTIPPPPRRRGPNKAKAKPARRNVQHAPAAGDASHQ